MTVRPEGRAVTIFDVALAAAVSQATVSRVVNGKSTVDPAIARRVLAVVDELGYRPSATARNLARGSTQTVGVLVPDLGNPMFQEVLRGVTQAASAAGYRVLVADSQESLADEPELAAEARRRCDALVLVAPRMTDDELGELLPRLAPVVLVNRSIAGTPEVVVDYAAGAAAAADHLAGLGHTRIAYLAGPPSSESNRRRLAGLERARSRHADLVVSTIACGATVDDGARAAGTLGDATGVIAFNDLVAFGLLAALRDAGVRVPGSVSVVGFDDIEFARYATPALTTMAVPRQLLGARAWDALLAEIEGGAAAAPVLFTPTLVVRSSTAEVER
ncbi:LacI family DNA-binding transcriptional regulator [Conyzicola sp.]|uniref:LacI family DNA-binding transcriptional regulator n=1 Tax=Conyzicola sp. TaxID=1969404 RepID=UPI0039890BDA